MLTANTRGAVEKHGSSQCSRAAARRPPALRGVQRGAAERRLRALRRPARGPRRLRPARGDAPHRRPRSRRPHLRARLLPDERLQPLAPELHDGPAAGHAPRVELHRREPDAVALRGGVVPGPRLRRARPRQDLPRGRGRVERRRLLEHDVVALLPLRGERVPETVGRRGRRALRGARRRHLRRAPVERDAGGARGRRGARALLPHERLPRPARALGRAAAHVRPLRRGGHRGRGAPSPTGGRAAHRLVQLPRRAPGQRHGLRRAFPEGDPSASF